MMLPFSLVFCSPVIVMFALTRTVVNIVITVFEATEPIMARCYLTRTIEIQLKEEIQLLPYTGH